MLNEITKIHIMNYAFSCQLPSVVTFSAGSIPAGRFFSDVPGLNFNMC